MSSDASATRHKFIAEVIGTYILVFAGTGAVVANQVSGGEITHVGIALTFGFVVMTLIYTIGDISGAHINPAVTIGFWVAKRFPGKLVLPYVLSQCLGAILASATLRLLFFENPGLGGTHPAGPWWQSFILELLLTAILMFVVLNVTTGSQEKGLMAGTAIGSLIALEAMFAGPISGASMNPARSLGPALVSGQLSSILIYLTAPVLGAALGVLAFHSVRPSVPR
ncbi:MIP/aquaporin family protein [Planctomicrobium sp. SH661]|uniref:MIP/aquaporin family protein n=1 Tax=Planctomicrobium sp. SH661 TaxID=3448124 RepID=UPI003F5C866A